MRRVFVSQLMHETNTFSRLRCSLKEFEVRELLYGASVLEFHRGAESEIGGFMSVAQGEGWTLAAGISADATPTGVVTGEAFERLLGGLVSALSAAEPVDGVLLSLHGAMVAEGVADADGETLARVRALVGSDIPIVATLDLHANVSDRMAANCNGLIAYRTYPHVDLFERGVQAASLLSRAMQPGAKRMRVTVGRGPQIDGCNQGRTTSGQMPKLLAVAAEYEKLGWPVVSIQAGFPWADVAEAGPSVAVTAAEGVDTSAMSRAILDAIWADRTENSLVPCSTAELQRELRHPGPGGPLVISDFSDNPGGGGYGDATRLLELLLSQNTPRSAFAPLWDPAAAQAGHRAGVGGRITLSLGGHTDPRFGGEPLALTGIVNFLSDGEYVCSGPMYNGRKFSLGPSMLFRVGEVEIIVTTNRLQVFDLNYFKGFGIDPAEYSVIALKSMQHFRGAYEPIARKIVYFDSGGLVTSDLRKLPYVNARRPVWPLDEIADR